MGRGWLRRIGMIPTAPEELKVSERQVRRLLVKLEQVEDKAAAHGLRGRLNRRIKDEVRQKAVQILSGDVYKGFGPTLASEYLAKKHQLVVSKETARQWMRQAGLWRPASNESRRFMCGGEKSDSDFQAMEAEGILRRILPRGHFLVFGFSEPPIDPDQLVSSVIVLRRLATSRVNPVNGTFLLCSNRTFSLCRDTNRQNVDSSRTLLIKRRYAVRCGPAAEYMKKRHIRLANIYYAAAEIMCRKGYDATTLGEIAAAVDLTKAGLYHYFQSKEELLFSMVNFAMDRVQESVIDPVRDIADPKLRLRTMTLNYVNLIMETGGDLTHVIEESNKLQRTRARKIEERRNAFYDFVRASVHEAKALGALPGISAGIATRSFFGVILFMAQWYRPSGSLSRKEVAGQIVRLTVDRMLLGDATDAVAAASDPLG